MGSQGAPLLTAAILVLVVAPDKDFRRSLAFALEADGFAVDTHARSSNAFASQRADEAECAVVDDAAIGDWRLAEEEFRRFGKPVFLLVGKIRPVPDLPFTTILTKPFLGNPLIEAVREVAAGGA
jgi:hypothetical protein